MMVENGKISPFQFGVLVFMFSLGTPVIRIPNALVSASKQNAWLSILFAIVVTAAIVFLHNRLAERFPNETIIQYNDRILGKWIGKIISFTFIFYFLLVGAFGLRGVGDFLTTVSLVKTPIDAIHLLFMVVVVYGAKQGLEVIGRCGEVLIPWVILMSIVIGIFLLPKMDFSNMLPILPNGGLQPLKGVYSLLGNPITQLVVFLMIYPFVNQHKKAKRWFYAGIFFNLVFLLMIIVASISVLGVSESIKAEYSTYTLVQQVNVGDFLERIEAFVAGVWFITIFMKVVLLLYVTCLATSQCFNFKDYRPFLLPFALIFMALAIIIGPNIAYLDWFVAESWPVYSIIQGLLIPTMLLLIAKVRKLHQN